LASFSTTLGGFRYDIIRFLAVFRKSVLLTACSLIMAIFPAQDIPYRTSRGISRQTVLDGTQAPCRVSSSLAGRRMDRLAGNGNELLRQAPRLRLWNPIVFALLTQPANNNHQALELRFS
jgi:hypothetical protein